MKRPKRFKADHVLAIKVKFPYPVTRAAAARIVDDTICRSFETKFDTRLDTGVGLIVVTKVKPMPKAKR